MNQLLNSHSYVHLPANRRYAALGWTLLFFFAGLFTTPGLKAQLVLSEGFEADCENPANAFFTGCFPNWISTHGTPDNLSNTPNIQPGEGNKYAHAYVQYKFNCFTGNAASAIRGEGMAITYDFRAGVTYRLSFLYRTSGIVQTRQCILTNGLPNQTGGSNFCESGERIPATPVGSQVIYSPNTSSLWQSHEVEFTPNANFSQLWFRGANDNPPTLNWNAFGDFYLDAVQLEIICDPYSGVAAYHFEDVNGIEKTEFCFGEDVYLDGRASENESRYFIDAWRRPIGSTGAFNWVASLGWTVDQQVDVINLTGAFNNAGYTFEPGYEYQIKLAISNPPCIAWTEVVHEFTLVCCNNISAAFRLDLVDNGLWFSLRVHGYQGYENVNAVHEWIVLSSPNPTTGPYTTEARRTTTGAAPFVVFDQAQERLYYTVVHRVRTLCGSVCYGKQRYADNGDHDGSDANSDESCEFCGAFDCALFDSYCSEPREVSAAIKTGGYGINVQWSRVAGATAYEVRIIINDPEFCDDSYEPIYINLSTTQTQLNINLESFPDCFSYQVAAVCEGGAFWSPKEFFQYHVLGLNSGQQEQDAAEPVSPQPKVFPNPTQDQITVSFNAPFTGRVDLIDPFGRVVDTQVAEEAGSLSFDLAPLPAGFYWVFLQTEAGVQKLKVVKQ